MARIPTLEQWVGWKIPGGSDWTDWLPFVESTIDDAPGAAGVYVLALPDGHEIGRLLRTDPHGVLDVGESGDLRKRLYQLYRATTQPGARGHSAGWRLGATGLLSKLGYTSMALRVAWLQTGSKLEAVQMEGAMLDTYFEIFGEAPPLNYKHNWAQAASA